VGVEGVGNDVEDALLPLAREANQDLGAAGPEALKHPRCHYFHELDAGVDDVEESVFVAQHADKVPAKSVSRVSSVTRGLPRRVQLNQNDHAGLKGLGEGEDPPLESNS
jgi:hypothetical protein